MKIEKQLERQMNSEMPDQSGGQSMIVMGSEIDSTINIVTRP